MSIEELEGSPTESWDGVADKVTATRRLKVPWNDRYPILLSLLQGGGTGYPHNPGAGLIAVKGSIAAHPGKVSAAGESTQLTSYEFAIITITYATPDVGVPEPGPDGILYTERWEPVAEFMTLDHRKFAWGASIKPIDNPETPIDESANWELEENEAPSRLWRGFDYVLTKHKVSGIPSAVFDLPGTINEQGLDAVLTPGMHFEAETLLFNPPTITKTTSLEGETEFTITYRFTYRRPPGWNTFWRTVNGEYEKMYIRQEFGGDGEAYKNYPLGNFKTI